MSDVAIWGAILKDCQLLQILYGLHALILVPHIWLMDESPRWLWGHGKIKEATYIIEKALKMNRTKKHIDIAMFVSNRKAEERKYESSASLVDIFKFPNLRKRTLNICLCFFGNSLVYWGLSLNTNDMKGDPYVTLFIMGLIEIPSYGITIYLMDKFGRRSVITACMVAGGLCCIIAVNLGIGSNLSTTIAMLGKFLISSSFAIAYNYAAELFPTVVRNSAIGLGSMCARISSTLAPFLILFDSFDPKLPSTIFSIVALIAGFFTMFLPETLGKKLPQTLQEGEVFQLGDTACNICFKNRKGSPYVKAINKN